MLDVQMDFVNLREYAAVLGSGAILVMDEGADMVDMLQSVLHFSGMNHVVTVFRAGLGLPSL